MATAISPRHAGNGSATTGEVWRLRVAHVTANFADGSGGITLREALSLDPGRFESTILAPEDGSPTLFQRAEAAGLQVLLLHRMGRGRRVYPWADMEALRELESHLRDGGYDVVHTHAGRAGAIGRIAAHRVGRAAIVHTLHGFPFNEFQPLPVRRTLEQIERRLGRITDFFLTDGTFVASEAVRLRIARPERVRAVITPIDPVPRTSPARRRAARRALGLPDDVRVVGTAARLAEQKAPLDMVKALAALPRDVHMVWLGDGVLREAMRKAIEREGLADRFLLPGERDDVADLLPAFDVFAMSSLWEGLPCGIVEAMTCGIPVVATAVNSVPEIVVSGRTGMLARPRDPASLAGALAYVLDHPDDGARMAEAARRNVGEQFRSDRLGRELGAVYERARTFAGAEVS
ncbi:MAG TPA: glycosyltransferase [Candidatus Limnocylindrales bacterium]|nr:glycosyltransferase [Candidatus Limnocylindrales bacterium]